MLFPYLCMYHQIMIQKEYTDYTIFNQSKIMNIFHILDISRKYINGYIIYSHRYLKILLFILE